MDESSDNWADYPNAETLILSVATATVNRGSVYDPTGNGKLTVPEDGVYLFEVGVNFLDYDDTSQYSLHLGRKPLAGAFAQLSERLETVGGGSRGHQTLKYMGTFALGDELDVRCGNDSTSAQPAKLNAFSVTVQKM